MKLPFAEQWFVFEEHETVEKTLKILTELNIPELRTLFSWADWERPGGKEWFDFFTSRLSQENIRLMPCLFYTPLNRTMKKPGSEPRTNFPPENPGDFTDFVNEILENYSNYFEWIQLWNEPNWQVYWDQELDPESKIFANMVSSAIDAVHAAGKKAVLGGLSPYEPEWINRMNKFGVLQKTDAIGIHAFPGTWDTGTERRTDRPWKGLKGEINDLKDQLNHLDSKAESWYTETGFSTFGSGEEKTDREKKQIDFFNELIECGADRTYWHTVIDQYPKSTTDNELNANLPKDERAYFFGLADFNAKPKPIVNYWKKMN